MTTSARDSIASPISTTANAWADALDTWPAHLVATGRATATADTYARHVGWLATSAADLHPDPWTLPPGYVAGWLAGQSWSASTRRKALVSLRAFYGWGIDQGWCARSPLAGLAAPPPRKRGPRQLQTTPLWREPVAAYLTHLEAGARRPGSIDVRRWWLIRLSETYADPWSVSTADLALWLSRDDYALETKRSGLSSIRGFYAWAEDAGHVGRSPARGLAAISRPRGLPRPAPDDAVRAALSVADDRTRLALQLALYAGLRRAELAGLHSADILDDQLHIRGKGGHERMIPIHPDLAVILRRELRRRLDGTDVGSGWGAVVPAADGWVFPSTDPAQPLTPHHLGKLVSAVLPAGWTAHALRHRFATQAYRAGRDLRAVQELLGHSKPETTARYAAVPDGALAAAVSGVGL